MGSSVASTKDLERLGSVAIKWGIRLPVGEHQICTDHLAISGYGSATVVGRAGVPSTEVCAGFRGHFVRALEQAEVIRSRTVSPAHCSLDAKPVTSAGVTVEPTGFSAGQAFMNEARLV